MTYEDEQGSIKGRMLKSAGGAFEINGEGETKGVPRERAKVRLIGRVFGNEVRIEYALHSQ